MSPEIFDVTPEGLRSIRLYDRRCEPADDILWACRSFDYFNFTDRQLLPMGSGFLAVFGAASGWEATLYAAGVDRSVRARTRIASLVRGPRYFGAATVDGTAFIAAVSEGSVTLQLVSWSRQ